MKTKKIYLLRHGQTDYNQKGMVQGCGIDAPLNETGRKQSKVFYEAYREVPFDKIYISSLIRTRQTIDPFIQKGIPFEVVEGLKEISWGNQEGIAFTEESNTTYQQVIRRWAAGDLKAKIEGGETPEEVMIRQREAMKLIMSREDEKIILICAHGRAMRILLTWLLHEPLSTMDHYPHTNCGVYILEYDGENFTIEQFNEVGHLSGIELNRLDA